MSELRILSPLEFARKQARSARNLAAIYAGQTVLGGGILADQIAANHFDSPTGIVSTVGIVSGVALFVNETIRSIQLGQEVAALIVLNQPNQPK